MFQYRPLITPQIDNTIQELIKELEFLPNLCEKISENVNKQYATNFTSIQIRQYLKDMLQVKIPQNRGEPFTEQIDNSIKEFMREVGQLSLSNPYVKIKEKINKQYNKNYTSKQIRQRWISKLNTNLCHEPLDNDEKLFIIRWAENTPRARGDKINWKDLIPMMNHQFGKLRSESVVKNFWNLRKRSQENKSKTENENSRKRKRCSKSKEKDEQQHKKICPEFITFEYKNVKYIKSSSPNGGLNASPMKKLFKNEKKNPSSPLNQNPIEILSENEENIPTPPLKAIPMEILSENEENIPTSPLNSNSIEILSENEENVPSSPLNANPVEILFENEEHTPSSAMEILCLVADAMYKRDFSRSELNYNVCR